MIIELRCGFLDPMAIKMLRDVLYQCYELAGTKNEFKVYMTADEGGVRFDLINKGDAVANT